jgi:hypothetical protein
MKQDRMGGRGALAGTQVAGPGPVQLFHGPKNGLLLVEMSESTRIIHFIFSNKKRIGGKKKRKEKKRKEKENKYS